jgi:hypothetical protein
MAGKVFGREAGLVHCFSQVMKASSTNGAGRILSGIRPGWSRRNDWCRAVPRGLLPAAAGKRLPFLLDRPPTKTSQAVRQARRNAAANRRVGNQHQGKIQDQSCAEHRPRTVDLPVKGRFSIGIIRRRVSKSIALVLTRALPTSDRRAGTRTVPVVFWP